MENGSMTLPEFIAAKNLHFISIRNCRIKEYYEHDEKQKYPDSLRELFFADNIIEKDTMEWIRKVESPTVEKRHIVCGYEKGRSVTYRNVSYRFYNFPKNMTKERQQKLYEARDDTLKSTPWQCQYSDLIAFEYSGRPFFSKSFLEEITTDAHYPKMSTIILRSNNIRNIPKELQKWYEHFPALKYLDLSDNKITTFSFDVPATPNWNTSLRVNLQNNNITEEPKDFKWYPHRAVPIIVNLHGNPIFQNKN
jgi:hypothetical protein